MITAISIMVVMILFFGLVGWWFVAQSSKPKYNGLKWKLDGSGIELVQKEPEGQKPFFFNYRWYDLFPRRRPLYLWEEYREGEETKTRHWEPKKPVDHKIMEGKDYVTPNELYGCTDWSCAKRFESVPNKFTQAVKLGAAVIMVIVCVVGMIIIFDTVNKPSTAQTAHPPAQVQTIGVNK